MLTPDEWKALVAMMIGLALGLGLGSYLSWCDKKQEEEAKRRREPLDD